MGNCVSFQISCDQTVNSDIRFLFRKGYIRNLKENLRALKREMEDLNAIQHQVQNKVAREETQGQQRLQAVQVWLTRVENINREYDELLSTGPIQLQKLCLCGFCSKNVCSSYIYGKRVFLLLGMVKNLKLKFEVVTEPAPRSKVEEMPIRPTIGQEEMLKKAWNRLMEDGVGIMGLHGMGGVGKTTLFKKIHNMFVDRFDNVIWIVVSQGTTISKLQKDIGRKLHLCDQAWENKDELDKAADIHKVLKSKRFVLMLDDIWEKVDLEAIGVPFPNRENGCKVAFTTRSQDVCGQMGDHEPMQVNCLGQKKAWELFKNKVGDNTLRRDTLIVELAKKVAEKCCGLPLALNVIGGTMASKKTIQEWDHAIDVLTRSAAEFSDMENIVLPILKYSYNSLVDENIKSCFLNCALSPEDYEVDKEKLIDYWICEGFIGEYKDIKRAKNKGYDILGTLVRANLLTETDSERVVMHDVVREMALWIASDFGEQKENFVVQAGVGLHEIPNVKDWGAVRRMSLMDNNIEEMTLGSKCCELTTLLLQNNRLKNLLGEFIQSVQKLVILDLSRNCSLNELPEQISELASLQYLDLSYTSIEQLPVGFQELKKLTHLLLSSTKSLSSISGISKLSNLRVLNLFCSKLHGDVSLLKELQLLEHLEVLSITISTESALEVILGDQRLANCIDDLEIEGFQQKRFSILELLVSMKNLRTLSVESNQVLEINTDMECRERETDSSYLHNPKIPCFTNLYTVCISRCNGIKDLTCILFAPNLVFLNIGRSRELEEIIKEEKATNLTGIITPFQKLKFLGLRNLPKLKSIYWSPLPFPFLEEINIECCENLRKLPLNVTSVPRVGEFTIRSNFRNFEWEDQGTEDRFKDSIKGHSVFPDL